MTAAGEAAAGVGVGIRDASRLAADNEKALQALREEYGYAYDIGIVTVAEKVRPILLWVAIRLEGEKPEPLLGFTSEALEAALRDDWGEEP